DRAPSLLQPHAHHPNLLSFPTRRSSDLLTFYYYPEANCTPATCQLDVGFISSTDGGTSWSKEVQLAGPTQLAWLANTDAGVMVGDYISTSIIPIDGLVLPVFALASLLNGRTL